MRTRVKLSSAMSDTWQVPAFWATLPLSGKHYEQSVGWEIQKSFVNCKMPSKYELSWARNARAFKHSILVASSYTTQLTAWCKCSSSHDLIVECACSAGLNRSYLARPQGYKFKGSVLCKKAPGGREKLNSLAIIFPFPLLSVISSTEATFWEEQTCPSQNQAGGFVLSSPA